jgi:polyhydroxyalkanoate synthase subunit PhaC
MEKAMSWDIWTQNPFAWPLLTMEMWRGALEAATPAPPAEGAGPEWCTPNRLTLELDALRLWDFSIGDAGAPVLIVAPYALHDAQLADLAPGHSIVQALLRHGCQRLYLAEWKSATPATRLFGIDAQLAALNVAVDDLDARVDLVGPCQGGWLSLVYAARFPRKIRRIVVAGAPIDVEATGSALSEPVEKATDHVIDRLIEEGGGIVKGKRMAPLWPREDCEERRLIDSLQLEPPFSAPSEQAAIAAFQRWDRRVVDLPGPYYREVVCRLFRENLLARGAFPAMGKTVDLSALDKPLFLLAGAHDAIAPPGQALAGAALVAGEAVTATAPCGHLALFMGRQTIEHEWARIASWLSKN